MIGFRKYAVNLVKFLEKEIYGELGGYSKYIDNNNVDFRSNF